LLIFEFLQYQNLMANSGPYAADARSKGIFQSIGFKELMPYLHLSTEMKKAKKALKFLKNVSKN